MVSVQIRGDVYFYPRSPCGERRHVIDATAKRIDNFYPRSPCGERRLEFCDTAQHTYFYPRSPCGERPDIPPNLDADHAISIHALLAESDV